MNLAFNVKGVNVGMLFHKWKALGHSEIGIPQE